MGVRHAHAKGDYEALNEGIPAMVVKQPRPTMR
jgi:hypothetical protein